MTKMALPTAADVTAGKTDEAFKLLVENSDLWKRTGAPSATRRQLLFMLNNNKGISLDTKEKWLTAAGFDVAQETVWEVPPEPADKRARVKAVL